MLFQGQEFGVVARRSCYFADHDARARRDRARRAAPSSCRSSRSIATAEAQARLADPGATRPRSSAASSISGERERHAELLRACIATCCACAARIPSSAISGRGGSTARCSATRRSCLRFFGDERDDRLLLVNLGRDLRLTLVRRAAARAAATARRWRISGRARIPRYGGRGTPPPSTATRLADPGARRRAARSRARRVTPDRADTASGSAPMSLSDSAEPTATSRRAVEHAARPRMAGDQRPRRLRLGHGRGVATRRYHGLLIAALPAPARPHDDAQPPARAGSSRPTARASARRRGARRPASSTRPDASSSPSSGSRRACRSGATRSTASSLEKRVAPAAPPEHRRTSTYRLLEGERPVRLELRPALHFRPHDAPRRRPTARRAVRRCSVADDRYRARAPSADLPPLRLQRRRQRAPRSSSTAAGTPSIALPRRGEPRLRVARRALEPRATSASSCAAGAAVALVASTEPWDVIAALDAERGARRPSSSAAGGCSTAAAARRAAARRRELVLAADQFIITPAGRVAGRARARTPPATRSAPSSPATTGSPTGAATR